MWTTILWIFSVSLVAWVFYKAWDNIQFEGRVEGARQRRTDSGELVQSVGEKTIADWLHKRGIRFEYDKPVTYSLREPPLRPDFFLPDYELYIEFYGMMDDPSYVLHRKRKERIYEMKGWRVVALTPEDLPKLDIRLPAALASIASEKHG